MLSCGPCDKTILGSKIVWPGKCAVPSSWAVPVCGTVHCEHAHIMSNSSHITRHLLLNCRVSATSCNTSVRKWLACLKTHSSYIQPCAEQKALACSQPDTSSTSSFTNCTSSALETVMGHESRSAAASFSFLKAEDLFVCFEVMAML